MFSQSKDDINLPDKALSSAAPDERAGIAPSLPAGDHWTDFIRHLTTANTMEQLGIVIELTTEAIFAWDAFFFSVRLPGRDVFLRLQAVDTIQGKRVRLGSKKETPDSYSPPLQPLFRQEGILINRAMESDQKLISRFGDVTRPSMSLMYVPVTGATEVEGIISVQSYTPYRYSSKDLQRLMDLAALAAPALNRAQAEREIQHQERRFRRLLELTTDAIVLADAESGEILEANKQAEEFLGRSFASMLDLRFQDFFTSEDQSRIKAFIDTLFSVEESAMAGLVLNRHDGGVKSLDATASLIEHYGRAVVMFRLRESANALGFDEQRLLLASFPELNPNPIVELTRTGEVIYINSEAERLFPDLPRQGMAHPFMSNLLLEADRHQQRGKSFFLRDVEINDQWFEQMVHLTQPNRLRVYAFDITSRKKSEAKLRFDALHDALTKLPNRVLFLDRLSKALKRAGRDTDAHLAVFFMDLDNFKVVNDTMGHHMGDELLKEFANRIQQCLRPGDTLARLGGDEFTILLDPISTLETATQVAERILETTKKPFLLNDQEFHITTSIGIAYQDTDERKADELLHDADVAMYHAKRRGKNQFIVYEDGLQTVLTRRKLFTSDVRRALDQEFFSLHYQPVISLPGRRIAGWEALARWYHPERGAVPPAEFVALADDSGVGGEFAAWALDEACRQVRLWELKFGREFTLHINMSGRQMLQPGLMDQISRTLQNSELAPERLILDIAEHDFMNHAQGISEIQTRLKKDNVRLCLDDFGTSYTSLNYLTLNPFDFIKVDRTFVHRLTSDPHCQRVFNTAGALSQALGCQLIAEGVEDELTLEWISNKPCAMAQGFFFSSPLDAVEADRFMTQQFNNDA